MTTYFGTMNRLPVKYDPAKLYFYNILYKKMEEFFKNAWRKR